MPEKSVAQKLLIKSNYRVLFLDPPDDYESLLGEMPENVEVTDNPTGSYDLIQLFVISKAQLEAQLNRLKKLLNPKGLLWVTYPKGTSKVKADINRDSINAYAHTIGLEGVAMVSVDDTWSALRLKVL